MTSVCSRPEDSLRAVEGDRAVVLKRRRIENGESRIRGSKKRDLESGPGE
jgi:hypothetical protein